MMTIHDISLLDNWHGTRTCGIAGDEILKILKKHNITPEFDVQNLWDGKGNLKDLKFIICGIPHNSLPEKRVMELIFSEINPSYLPELWKDNDFQRIDREHSAKELKKCLEKISEYEEHARTKHSNGSHSADLISKHTVFDFIFEIRGVTVGITPKRFYKCPEPKYSTDEKGVSRMVSHLPEGWYTILRILNNNSFEPVCLEEFWITTDSELFSIIDTKRGRSTLDTPVMQTSAS